MARKKNRSSNTVQLSIESYEHRDKERLNNPPAGLVTPQNDPDVGQQKKRYAYDPHLDPQLVWAGKAEHTSFEVPTVSLHVHERIDPKTIIEAVRKKNSEQGTVQLGLFEEERQEPLREAIEFYQHKHGWTNRLIAGDSLLVMNSLLEKEGMAGKVQMIYIDPPYGIKYGSNFQPFVNKRDVKDGKDEDLTAEPEQIKAFRDTWELGIHSYLTYLRDRLLLARELLSESGSIFVQISDENVHRVRCLMDEVFGAENFHALITFTKTRPLGATGMPGIADYILWYGRDVKRLKFRPVFIAKEVGQGTNYTFIEESDGKRRKMTKDEKSDVDAIASESRVFQSEKLASSGYTGTCYFDIEYRGQTFPPKKTSWRTNREGIERLKRAARLHVLGDNIYFVSFFEDNPEQTLANVWTDTRGEMDPIYAVQTTEKVIQRCLLMTTDPGDLVFDPTCVRKGTRVWRVDGSPPVVPPHAGGQPTPSPLAGRDGEGHPPSPLAGRVGEGHPPSPLAGRVGEGHPPSPLAGRVGAGHPPSPLAGRVGAGHPPSPLAGRVGEGHSLTPIESIRPGDLVLGHDGLPHRVLRVIRRTYRGPMVGIRHKHCAETLWVTADHRILVHRRPHSLGGKADWSGIPKSLRGRSKELRRNMTPPERKLWSVLRANRTGFAFRRQHPIGPYVADFYCREAALVVEVDGAIAHSDPAAVEHDRTRDEYMRALGLKVLRFPASEVMRNVEGVSTAIRAAARTQISPEHAEWMEAAHIEKGDIVFYGPHRIPVRVDEVVTAYSEEEVYDLEVEGVHSFLTEVCAVHNCGSGTTAYVAEQWGRRWITCDTSRVALAIARQRLMTAVFDYYELAHPEEGVGSGFRYKTVPHVTLKSIANNPEIDGIYARMHPAIEQALADLNAALKGHKLKFRVTTGGREGHFVDFAAPDDATFTMPSGQVVKVNELVEWEVPFEFPEDWPDAARKPFEAFHQARRAMQKEMDEAIARHAEQETLYDQPYIDRSKVRVTGPFTVEAVPAPVVKSPEEVLEHKPQPADTSIARSGETLRQAEWRDELLKTGIRGKAGQYIRFSRLEPLPGARFLHAVGETRPSAEGADSVREDAPAYNPMRVAVSFGPEHAPLEQRQVQRAWEEAQQLNPKPQILIFAAFQFDPEAAKDIDEMKPELAGMQFLKVQMNADLLTEDLKKKRASNESFWLIGQPDVEVRKEADGKYIVEVHGFDYYNTKTGQVESGGKDKIACWMLDTDYDGRALYPRQVFFPIADEDEAWARLARNLKAEIDPERIRAYWGTVSLPFEPGEYRRIAVKIVDDRGIESMKVLEVE